MIDLLKYYYCGHLCIATINELFYETVNLTTHLGETATVSFGAKHEEDCFFYIGIYLV